MQNTRIVYEYRDGSGCRRQETVVVEGSLALADIADVLDEGEFFIPSQVGMEDLQLRFAPETLSSNDHVWHRFVEVRPTEEGPTITATAAQLRRRFNDVTWDEEMARFQLYMHKDGQRPSMDSVGKVIYLKRKRKKTVRDMSPWPVLLVSQTPVTWYGYSAHGKQEGDPVAYSKLAWTQVPPPVREIVVLNFAGPLTVDLWVELFAGWEQLRMLPDVHHLLINSSLWLAGGRGIHATVSTLVGRIASARGWKEGRWGEYAHSVVALYPEQEGPRALLQQALVSLFGTVLQDARQDMARRQAMREHVDKVHVSADSCE